MICQEFSDKKIFKFSSTGALDLTWQRNVNDDAIFVLQNTD